MTEPTELDRLDPAPPPPEPTSRYVGPTEAAIIRDLARLPEDLRESAVAVSARILAHSLDEGEMIPKDAVVCVREIRMCIAQLREWNPAGDTGDETDATREQMENVTQIFSRTGSPA
jgi:hypothetical protein